MGFPEGHTKWNGVAENSYRQRRKLLGNSFQVDNIMYLLHPLKVCRKCRILDHPACCSVGTWAAGLQCNLIQSNASIVFRGQGKSPVKQRHLPYCLTSRGSDGGPDCWRRQYSTIPDSRGRGIDSCKIALALWSLLMLCASTGDAGKRETATRGHHCTVALRWHWRPVPCFPSPAPSLPDLLGRDQ